MIRSWLRVKASPFRFEWRDKVAQFWNKTVGRLVPRLQVRQAADHVIDVSPVREWAEQVASGEMSVGAWHQNMRDEIRRNVIEQYLAGRGGTGPMTAKDYGSIGGVVADQYRYLDPFAAEVAAGNLSAGQIAMRSVMYINSAREAYERAQRRAVEQAGFNEVRWVEDPSPEVDHCEDCVELAGRGWLPAKPWPFRSGRRDIYPGSGDTICLTSCRCFLNWRKRASKQHA